MNIGEPGFGRRIGAGAAEGGGAQLYSNTLAGDRHKGTRQGDRGCERARTGGVLVLKLELAHFYVDIEQHIQLLVLTSQLHT